MALRYLDPATGQYRLKIRYAWGLRGLVTGLLVGMILVQLL